MQTVEPFQLRVMCYLSVAFMHPTACANCTFYYYSINMNKFRPLNGVGFVRISVFIERFALKRSLKFRIHYAFIHS